MNNKVKGFTLLEILIALFIFTILSMILVTALHNVINLQSRTENAAERLRNLQISLLMMSRDIEQTVNRPVWNSSGKEDPAFVGSTNDFTFTHAGLANSNNSSRSGLQRVRYTGDDDTLARGTWAELDAAPQSQMHTRVLLKNVSGVRFEYLDKDGHFQSGWPLPGDSSQALPKAVRIYLTISNWGTITQLYVIPAKASKITQLPKKS